MAAYAALVSLMNTVEKIQNQNHNGRHSISVDKNQMKSLLKKVHFLRDFIETNSFHRRTGKEAEDLETEITDAAQSAEDAIEFQVVDQIIAGSIDRWTSFSFSLDLQKVLEDLESLREKAVKVKEKEGFRCLQPTYSQSAPSLAPIAVGKKMKMKMIGFDDELIQLMDVLTGQESSRKIIPIVGMGGVGKTTLARNAFENSLIVQHFDVRAWVTVSQEYSVEKILLGLLSHLKIERSELDKKTEEELGERLYKILFSRRYLIILDDMWSIEAWEKIKFFFPGNDNGSRILVTTRQSNMAMHLDSSFIPLKFLDEDKSWELFCETTFVEESCPRELEMIGKKITKKCKGLPLSIVVIGGLLRKSIRTEQHWESVAEDLSSILNSEEDEHCLKILSLSYTYLPAHLKPCLLYMGTFPEDREIRASLLVKIWVAEGFLKPNRSQSLEEVAEDYLEDLVYRNLILVRKWGLNGKIKTFSVHDLLRDICLRVGEKEKFFHVMRVSNLPQIIDMERRIVFHKRIPDKYYSRAFLDLQSVSLARSLICHGGRMPFKFALLRLLNGVDSYSLEDVFKQVNLRFIVYKPSWTSLGLVSSEIPSSICHLWNVQTLIIKGLGKAFVAPSEIWEMPQLRHLEFSDIVFPDPPSDRDVVVLENLQTLLQVMNFKFSEEVCKRIPNIKKLHLFYLDFSTSNYCLHNLARLHKLESLSFDFSEPNRDDFLLNLMFPSSLNKLCLKHCGLEWEDLTVIGSLPHLQVLKLELDSVIGFEWNPVEGEFVSLKFLKIHCPDLIYWNAECSHFPVLENLVLVYLLDLQKIPLDMGEIATLKTIRLDCCSVSAAISAIKILEEQENQGIDSLRVQLQFLEKADLESFREEMEMESFTCKNFQVVDPAYDYLRPDERSKCRGPPVDIKI